MIREAIQDISHRVDTGGGTGTVVRGSSDNTINIVAKEFDKVTTDQKQIITTDNLKADISYPYPSSGFKFTGTVYENYIQLEKPLKCKIISFSKDKNYVLSIDENTHQAELNFTVGSNSILINENYISINANHLVLNGVEYQPVVTTTVATDTGVTK